MNEKRAKLLAIKDDLNVLVDFLAKRDIEKLTSNILEEKYKISKVDLLILFGGCIPKGIDVFRAAYENNFAKNYMIVGGVGHTTDILRSKMQAVLHDFNVTDRSEAEIMMMYLKQKYDMQGVILETKSTNCGNNVINALDLVRKMQLNVKSIAFIQDATMQHRMEAGFKKYLKDDVKLINFAGYKAYFKIKDDKLMIEDNDLWGMWDKYKYMELLLGEIPRLRDDINGYGPNGKNFIAHVDIPLRVEQAFLNLKQQLNVQIRKANELFATK